MAVFFCSSWKFGYQTVQSIRIYLVDCEIEISDCLCIQASFHLAGSVNGAAVVDFMEDFEKGFADSDQHLLQN